ncbi:MAG TPA: hypothetical protein QGG47_07480 [Acidobacteriota bacterium]|nr:hypothetical protein [Acidobacteriota bacterium]
MSWKRIGASRLLVVVCAVLLPACNQTPTEITPLPKAIGEVEAILIDVASLQPLDPATEGIYYLWALLERSESESLATFNIGPGGQIVDTSGAPLREFRSDQFALRETLGILITVESDADAPEAPSGMQILSGTFIEGVATLAVPISSAITSAGGSMRVFSPTDGPNTNETSGIWMVDGNGDPSVGLPDTTAALEYELFIDINGSSVAVGRFDRADQADDSCRFCADSSLAPARPGEDLLTNASGGLAFPASLAGARITVSLEGGASDFLSRSQLIVLEGTVPIGVTPGAMVPLVNRTSTFPSGKAILF